MDQQSGNRLSALGFGCMRFPRGLNVKIDMDKTEKLILSAIERGVNYFDTAYLYPGSEEAVGAALSKNGARGKIFLATKLPHHRCKNRDDFERYFLEQLARLRTDYIDYYLIHNISDAEVWGALADMGIGDWIAEKKASGQIRRIGFSFHGSADGFLETLAAYPWDFCQIQYNYMDENYQAGRSGLKAAAKMGLPVIIMEPLLGGKLANGLPKKAVAAFRNENAERSPAAWALRWLWNQPEVTVVLSGMSSMDQLDDNIRAAESAEPNTLTEREASAYATAVGEIAKAYKIPCTGCNYCMPCPKGVNIPGCFAAYNASYAAGFVTGLQLYITSTGRNRSDRDHGGGNCVKCLKCERNCPQRIAISKRLEDVGRRMEPFWFDTAMKIGRKIGI
ncbi:MAG: aldo/keto reductase [Clostridiales bacterium]|nr:aldo/keto reductase [Clostridiales bacterium]